ncbi:GAF domain-containing protein [Aporhodopirellula aestuarii]|uniref:GAF domain-containing protein n=1 Tax=Aporhodopirellula aestuarii TaxID=2950107 RepID=A0ABT0UDL2_9BACT|nr:GAF domain-containing protein [Aporhodopirellula aestuarii]MCM2374856.1 GAF domain-containing protein [Aporhodopirellula aestuarii]
MSSSFHTIDHWSSNLSISSLPSNCFLTDVVVYDVGESGALMPSRRNEMISFAELALLSGTAEVTSTDLPLDAAAAIAIPVHCDGRVVSVVVLLARSSESSSSLPIGVFEVWEPIGIYDEVALKDGYYGTMERFHNVSSFVRFERGSGLPGQVWEERCGVIHDDLANHPGFLRAAGASADLLRTAIGIPVASDAFRSTAVLISSSENPIARGIEVWKVQPGRNEFQLSSAAYYNLGDDYPLKVGTRCSSELAPFSRLRKEKRVLVTDDPNELLAGRNPDSAVPGPASGLAIPFFEGSTLTSIILFLF